MRKYLRTIRVAIALLAFALARPGLAATGLFVVNGDIDTGTSPNYTGLAVVPDDPANTFWNPLTVTTTSFTSGALTESNGTTLTAITLSLGNVNAAVDGGGSGFTGGGPLAAVDMMRDYTYQRLSGGAGTFTLNNVPTGTYDLYLYSASNSLLDKSEFTFGSDIEDADNTSAGKTDFIANNNYVLFSGLTPVAGVITGTMLDITGTNDAFSLNGFQLVQLPEPASLGMLVLGGTLLLRRRRIS